MLWATEEVGLAYRVPIAVQTSSGQIVSFDGENYALSKGKYDKAIIAVVIENPGLVIEPEAGTGVAVMSDGQVKVLVNASNGELKVGDWIAASEVDGEGMKATEPGWVVGRALETLASTNNPVLVMAKLNVHYEVNPLGEDLPVQLPISNILRGALTDLFSVLNKQAQKEPFALFRYILAAIVIIIAVVFSYFTFGRVARSGVEAIGRNPLARRTIMVGVVFNVLFGLMIVFAGIVVAYYIIRL